jgi:hypothetical protein
MANRTFRCLLIALCGLAAWASHLDAQPPRETAVPRYDATRDRLTGLTVQDLTRLGPQIERGPVALVEFADTDGGELPGIHLALRVHASPAALAALVADPAAYPRYMRTLDEVSDVRTEGAARLYDWAWKIGLFRLSGRNAMTSLAPPPDRPDAGWRFAIDSQGGDFGVGRMIIRVLPERTAANTALLLISTRMDLRKSNYVVRQMAKATRSINRSANMSLAYAMALSFRREAERRAGYTPPAHKVTELAKPVVKARSLIPLLLRGDLVTLDMTGDHLHQVGVFALIHHGHDRVREIMLDANAFGAALVPGSEAHVVARDGRVTTFDWSIDIPLVGASGRMTMRDDDPILAIDAVEGALAGGEWRFEARAVSKRATMVSGWASFDLKRSTWLLQALANADPYLGHGMTAASEVMLVRALRTQSRDRK